MCRGRGRAIGASTLDGGRGTGTWIGASTLDRGRGTGTKDRG